MSGRVVGLSQATLFWKHAAWLERSSTKLPAYVNIDESAIVYSYHSALGMIQRKCRAQVRIGQQDSRGCMTHVALATNLLGLQAFLPQIFICNKRRLTRALERRLHSSVPQNVILLREDSSWNTSRHMVWLMALLGNLFRRRFPRHPPIIILDTASCHITPQVIRAACRACFCCQFQPD